AMRPHANGRLFSLIGCAGDLDRVKRPMMAQEVQRLADCVWVTHDNPRSVSPSFIFDDIWAVFVSADKLRFFDGGGQAFA
ncbi:UDP-N-acetylmuramoylalanyl-D-glutamate--2,6-diaminopimelate ligase, partial [Pseudomonas syringae pv. tagetis]